MNKRAGLLAVLMILPCFFANEARAGWNEPVGDLCRGDNDATVQAGDYYFPCSDGTSGQVLVTDGSGVLTWTNQTGGNGGTGSINIKEDGVSAATDVTILDFVGDFSVTESPEGTGRIALALAWTISGNNAYSSVSGNVGIGTTAPASKLDVSGGNVSITTVAGNSRVVYSDGTVTGYTGIDGTNLDLGTTSNHSARIDTNGTPRLTVTGAGNVGIATTNPVANLDIGATGSAFNKIRLAGNTSGGAVIQAQAVAGTPTLTLPTGTGTFAVSASGALALSATTGALTHSTSASYIHLPTGGSANQILKNSGVSGTGAWSTAYIDANGNLGIGTSTTVAPIHAVAGNNVITGAYLGGNSATYLQYKVKNVSAGNVGSGDFVIEASNGSETANFLDLGKNNPSFSDVAFTIVGGNGGYLYNDYGDLALGTSRSNYVSIFTGGTLAENERMRIDSAGNVGIGTTSPAQKLDVNGTIKATNITGIPASIWWVNEYPASRYAVNSKRVIVESMPFAMSLTSLTGTQDIDPTTEMNKNLKYADSCQGFANATLIVAMDSTAGKLNIKGAGNFSTSTIPSGKCVYEEYDAAPDSAVVSDPYTLKGTK